MSNDKRDKRDRDLQRRARARSAKTGESYQAAWRQLNGDEPTKPTESSAVSDVSNTRRVPLPMSTTVKILPGQSVHITNRPQLETFWPERLLIKKSDRWSVEEFIVSVWTDLPPSPNYLTTISELDPEEREKKSLKYDLLDGELPVSASRFSMETWHPLLPREVLCGHDIVIVVTYNGPDTDGECFEAVVFGSEGRPSVSPPQPATQNRVTERAESPDLDAVVEIPRNKSLTLSLKWTVESTALFVDRVSIVDAEDWVVHDIKTRGVSILVQSGDLPGEMFTDSAPVILEPLAKDDTVEIVVTYIGKKKRTRFAFELSGSTEPPSTPRQLSYFLPMSTGIPILPTQSAQITGRPRRKFIPERFVVADQDGWIINDIRVGITYGFAASGDIPGQSFSRRTVGSQVTLNPIHPGQDFVIVTTRADNHKKASFYCGVQGRIV